MNIDPFPLPLDQVTGMPPNQNYVPNLPIRQFETLVTSSRFKLEAVCVECGADLVVIVGGGERYHIGALALTISMPSINDSNRLTNSTYQVPVPGHKEEALAREGSLLLSQRLGRNVALSVGIHQDNLSPEGIQRYAEAFYALVDLICKGYEI